MDKRTDSVSRDVEIAEDDVEELRVSSLSRDVVDSLNRLEDEVRRLRSAVSKEIMHGDCPDTTKYLLKLGNALKDVDHSALDSLGDVIDAQEAYFAIRYPFEKK